MDSSKYWDRGEATGRRWRTTQSHFHKDKMVEMIRRGHDVGAATGGYSAAADERPLGFIYKYIYKKKIARTHRHTERKKGLKLQT